MLSVLDSAMNAVCSPHCTCHGTCISHAPGAAEALGALAEPLEPLELLAVAGGLGKAGTWDLK